MNNNNFKFEPNIYDIVRKNIKKYRKERDMSTTTLATYIGIEPGTLRQIECNGEKTKCGFSFDTLYKISVVLDVSLDKFIKK